ncbi:DUF4419 domain-containing protein [Sansalvadorimonas verongulae]|uniref:DUF4419 domain-containing protein n=1 Tax=Sansalvadorimonas verongulae TaxID=2172824 RepID=UPI0012BB6E0A|nr:DUF4419 domain-containing protein [Sansalvadorimonas verongulae]MTI14948.1 DUF4419 domain-containing protein [Sansalvadorimonas verongulae]
MKCFLCFPPALLFVWVNLVVAGVTFPVNDVTPATQKLPVYNASDRHEGFARAYNAIPASIKEARSLSGECFVRPKADECACDFASSIISAFRDHRPVEITPDAVWMMILQSFSAHINKNAEEFRDMFVSHEGRKTLCVECDTDSYPEGDHHMSELFCKQISKNIKDKTLVSLLSKPFSTSSQDDLTSFQFAIMGSVQEFFTFKCYPCSGIPYITLQGTVDDWKDLRDRFLHLKSYDLNDWHDVLDPVLKKFEETAGLQPEEVDKVFWQGMVKYFDRYKGSGPPSGSINGWIVNFYKDIRPDFYATGNLSDSKAFEGRAVGLDFLPFSRVKIPVTFVTKIRHEEHEEHYEELHEEHVVITGIMGAQQSPDSLALKPIVGWMRGKLKQE